MEAGDEGGRVVHAQLVRGGDGPLAALCGGLDERLRRFATGDGSRLRVVREFEVARPDGSAAGAGIGSVTSGGPAGRAGLQAGDVIISVGRTATPDTAALAQALAAAEPGQSVTVTVTRDGQQRTFRVTLGELPGS